MRNIISLLRLLRIHNCLIAGVGVWLGGYLSGLQGNEYKLLLASVAASLVCGAGNALNDYLDIEVDRINHPKRVLPSGRLDPYYAVVSMVVLNITAIGLSLIVNLWSLLVVLGAMGLLIIYNLRLKKMVLWGNLAVSFLSGATFIAGAVVNSPSSVLEFPGPLVPAIFAFLFHFGRELIKDAADSKGDRGAQYRTLPSVISSRIVTVVLIVNYLILIALTTCPILWEWYNSIYKSIVIYAVDIPMLMLLIYLVFSQNSKRLVISGHVLKVLMVFGLFAFILGKQ